MYLSRFTATPTLEHIASVASSSLQGYIYIYIYIHTYTYTHIVCVYIYIYMQRALSKGQIDPKRASKPPQLARVETMAEMQKRSRSQGAQASVRY